MMRRTYKPIIKMHNKGCSFCENKTEPNYKEIGSLTNFLTERGKIVGKARSGVCSTHQRLLSREIKRARIMALLPFVVRA
jgi:small subunit ribosomal protein S18